MWSGENDSGETLCRKHKTVSADLDLPPPLLLCLLVPPSRTGGSSSVKRSTSERLSSTSPLTSLTPFPSCCRFTRTSFCLSNSPGGIGSQRHRPTSLKQRPDRSRPLFNLRLQLLADPVLLDRLQGLRCPSRCVLSLRQAAAHAHACPQLTHDFQRPCPLFATSNRLTEHGGFVLHGSRQDDGAVPLAQGREPQRFPRLL